MAGFVAGRIDKQIPRHSSVLVLGLTFKENVPDLRNSKVVDIVEALRKAGHDVSVHDPLADPEEALEHYGIRLLPRLDGAGPFDAVVGAVSHAPYVELTASSLETLLKPGGLVADVKAIWRHLKLPAGIRRWEL
jgi:UDP-N-acetyl-D-galactosamine dehydrogenase